MLSKKQTDSLANMHALDDAFHAYVHSDEATFEITSLEIAKLSILASHDEWRAFVVARLYALEKLLSVENTPWKLKK